MDLLTMSVPEADALVLVGGSALVALGASTVIAAVLLWRRRRESPAVPTQVPAAEPATIDLYDTPPPVRTVAPDLSEIDRRLEDVERQIAHLATRLETALRRPAASVAPPVSARAPRVESVPEPSPEEIALRALVARSH